MIQSLSIKNFAIIENTSLSFNLGFNVLIGETGAGKSIILDALTFVLGGKPNKDDIRNGESSMVVKATFCNVNKFVQEKLKEFEIEYDNMLIITRSFTIEGKSTCNVNGEPLTVGMLKQLGILLMDMYGQHDSLSLLNTKNHIKMLDSYNEKYLDEEKDLIKDLLKNLKDINVQLQNLGGEGEDRERKIDILNYQIAEIEDANLKPNEDEELENQLNTLSNVEKITTSLNQAYNALSEVNFSQCVNDLEYAKNFDSNLESMYERMSSCAIELDDISMNIKDYLSSINVSEKEIDEIAERIELIKMLKRKYGSSIEEVLSFCENSKNELDNILHSEEIIQKLTKQKQDVKEKLYSVSKKLHEKRLVLAKEIEVKVEDELKTLGMNNTKFSISFSQIEELDKCNFTNEGIDEVEFLFSANAGEKERSLAKTISGGEMSRFMLALKNIFANIDDVDLLVFDEIDAGVSGEIGYKVGQKLATLSQSYQIICITHLPQVTALADKYIYIKKDVENGHTKSTAKYLDQDEIVEYLTSLFGTNKTEAGLTHAKELLQKAVEFKKCMNK